MCLETDRRKREMMKKKSVRDGAEYTLCILDAVHRLALAFLRVGNFLTTRCPGSGAACDDGAPIVKMALPLLSGVCI